MENRVLGQEPSDRRGVKELEGSVELEAGWRRVELTYFHTGREPEFSFEMEGPGFPRRPIPSSMLSVSGQPVPRFEACEVDARSRCARTGALRGTPAVPAATRIWRGSPPARAWAGVDPARGCLGESVGAWPRFDLTAEQRGWITQALPGAAEPRLDDQQMVDKTLVTLNCIACHERAGLGGISPERNAYFTGTQPRRWATRGGCRRRSRMSARS